MQLKRKFMTALSFVTLVSMASSTSYGSVWKNIPFFGDDEEKRPKEELVKPDSSNRESRDRAREAAPPREESERRAQKPTTEGGELTLTEQIALLQESVSTRESQIADLEMKIRDFEFSESTAKYFSVPVGLLAQLVWFSQYSRGTKMLTSAVGGVMAFNGFQRMYLSKEQVPELKRAIAHLKAYEEIRRSRIRSLEGMIDPESPHAKR